MTTKRIFLVLIWAILMMLGVDFGYGLLNQKDTYLNIAGVFVLAGLIALSYKTKAFTQNPFKSKTDE